MSGNVDDFTELMLTNAALYRALLAVGESIAEAAGQTHARSMCLQQIAGEPRTIANIATRMGMARQSVQRVADLLVADGLAGYAENPRHRRAQLMTITPAGRRSLRLMHRAHQEWVRRAAGALEGLDVTAVTGQLRAILEAVRRL